MRLLYRLSLFFYGLGIRLAALFGNGKARLWLRGRKEVWSKIQAWQAQKSPKKVLWMHCASLGEFEQGRPLAEAFLAAQPDYQLVLSFFSPSGYQVRKDYAAASAVFYLPMDGHQSATRFINAIQPDIAIFVKYEFWYYYLHTLHAQNIPLYLVSAIFRPQQAFFRWYGGFFVNMLHCFRHIFVQDADSAALLQQIHIHHHSITGDTRFDRVWAVRQSAKQFDLIDRFCQQSPILVAGSTWQPDEQLLFSYYKKELESQDWKIILVPHETDEAHLRGIERALQGTSHARYSSANPDNIATIRILIIDSIGMLSSLYRYGDLAYIGGGFGRGIHNSLEAAVYGIPVLFGKKYQKFAEAKELIKRKIAFSVETEKAMQLIVPPCLSSENKAQIKAAAQAYFEEQRGACARILERITI